MNIPSSALTGGVGGGAAGQVRDQPRALPRARAALAQRGGRAGGRGGAGEAGGGKRVWLLKVSGIFPDRPRLRAQRLKPVPAT